MEHLFAICLDYSLLSTISKLQSLDIHIKVFNSEPASFFFAALCNIGDIVRCICNDSMDLIGNVTLHVCFLQTSLQALGTSVSKPF